MYKGDRRFVAAVDELETYQVNYLLSPQALLSGEYIDHIFICMHILQL